MTRWLLRRLLLSLITLWLLATLVFIITNILPNDIGRTILGPFAPQESVDALNEKLGTNDPLIEQYLRSMRSLVTLDLGNSFQNNRPVMPQILAASDGPASSRPSPWHSRSRSRSSPGLYAGRHRDRPSDRAIVLARADVLVDPRIRDRHVPRRRRGRPARLVAGARHAPGEAGPDRRSAYLLMPALAMAIVYFGYIARMTRAGTIEVLESDYIRTATMKGLTTAQTIRRHVLRNALVPTVAVIGVQIGYLFGGIIGVEKIFNYNGMGQTMLFAAQRKDIPVLTAGVIVIGIVYMVATLAADLIIAWMNPRVRLDETR